MKQTHIFSVIDVYINIYIYMYTSIYTYINVYIHICIWLYMYVYIQKEQIMLKMGKAEPHTIGLEKDINKRNPNDFL